jgi:hypothetical protein
MFCSVIFAQPMDAVRRKALFKKVHTICFTMRRDENEKRMFKNRIILDFARLYTKRVNNVLR